MADETNTTTAPEVDKKAPTTSDLVSERNGTKLSLVNWTFLKGDNKDKKYPGIQVTDTNVQDIINWLGAADLQDVLQTFFKRTSQQIYQDNLGEDGLLNQQGFLSDLAALTSGGMTMKELNVKIEELQGEIGALIQNAIKDNSMGDPAVQKNIGVLNEKILSFRDKKEKRSRKKDTDAEPAVAA